MMADSLIRFMNFVDVQDGHWIWNRRHGPNRGFVYFFDNKVRVKPHAWAWKHWTGEAVENGEVSSICGVVGCVNPFHLAKIASQGKDRWMALKMCPSGHPIPENLRQWPSGPWYCKQCHITNSVEHKRMKRSKNAQA